MHDAKGTSDKALKKTFDVNFFFTVKKIIFSHLSLPSLAGT